MDHPRGFGDMIANYPKRRVQKLPSPCPFFRARDFLQTYRLISETNRLENTVNSRYLTKTIVPIEKTDMPPGVSPQMLLATLLLIYLA